MPTHYRDKFDSAPRARHAASHAPLAILPHRATELLAVGRGLVSTDVFLVPHTHWDRECYEPFQRFRLRLVDLMDDVISRAQRDPLSAQ